METTTKRGRRFERRLAERKRWAAMKDAQKRESILEALHEVLKIADEDEWARQSATVEIRNLMGDMMAMKDVVNSRDVARWYARLDSALAYLEGGKHNETD